MNIEKPRCLNDLKTTVDSDLFGDINGVDDEFVDRMSICITPATHGIHAHPGFIIHNSSRNGFDNSALLCLAAFAKAKEPVDLEFIYRKRLRLGSMSEEHVKQVTTEMFLPEIQQVDFFEFDVDHFLENESEDFESFLMKHSQRSILLIHNINRFIDDTEALENLVKRLAKLRAQRVTLIFAMTTREMFDYISKHKRLFHDLTQLGHEVPFVSRKRILRDSFGDVADFASQEIDDCASFLARAIPLFVFDGEDLNTQVAIAKEFGLQIGERTQDVDILSALKVFLRTKFNLSKWFFESPQKDNEFNQSIIDLAKDRLAENYRFRLPMASNLCLRLSPLIKESDIGFDVTFYSYRSTMLVATESFLDVSNRIGEIAKRKFFDVDLERIEADLTASIERGEVEDSEYLLQKVVEQRVLNGHSSCIQ